MMDDATLAVWEQHARVRQEGAYDPLIDYVSARWLLDAVAEIRRLRGAPDECPRNCMTFRQYGDCDHRHPEEIVKLKRDLAAHQAAVWELAELLSEELRVHRIQKNPGEKAYCHCGLYLQDDGTCRRKVAIEKALVVAVRKGGE